MAAEWVLGKVSNALQPAVQGVVGTAGSLAGGAMNTVGSSINGVGERINTGIRYYGDGAKDYGNAVMDWTKASGPRAQTASNPLGLSKSTANGKSSATNPSIYRAPAKPKKQTSLARKTAVTNGRVALARSPPQVRPISKPANKSASPNQPFAMSTHSARPHATKKTISPESRPKIVNKSAATASNKHPSKTRPNTVRPQGLGK